MNARGSCLTMIMHHHTEKLTIEFLEQKIIKMIDSLSHSPDLVMCDFWLFFDLKICTRLSNCPDYHTRRKFSVKKYNVPLVLFIFFIIFLGKIINFLFHMFPLISFSNTSTKNLFNREIYSKFMKNDMIVLAILSMFNSIEFYV